MRTGDRQLVARMLSHDSSLLLLNPVRQLLGARGRGDHVKTVLVERRQSSCRRPGWLLGAALFAFEEGIPSVSGRTAVIVCEPN
jgi:hypothetical protein